MKVESLCPSRCFIFLLLLFSAAFDVSFSSKSNKAVFHHSPNLQADLSLARVSQDFVSMFRDFRSRLQNVFKSQFWSAYRALSFCQFTIQNILWDSALLHSTNMPQPSHASLFHERVHAWQICSLKNLSVGNLVLSDDVQNASEISQVESVEFVLMPCVQSPRLTTIQKCAQRAALVDLNFGIFCEFSILPNSLSQPGHGG